MLVKCANLHSRMQSGNANCPPLGLLYIASALREFGQNQYDIKVINIDMLDGGFAELESIATSFKPDIVGLSAVTPEAATALSAARLMKSLLPGVKVVLGGPHVTMRPDTIKAKDYDFGVIGEGWRSFPRLVDALAGDNKVHNIKGIIYKTKNGTLKQTQPADAEDFDLAPPPAWDLHDFETYRKIEHFTNFRTGAPYASIITSLGCPFNCIYCHKLHKGKMRMRSAENVLNEIRLLNKEYGVREFVFVDDMFNFNRERMMTILRGIKEMDEPMKLSFATGLRGDMLDAEAVKAFVEAGTYYAMIPIETPFERLQKLIKKNLNVQKTIESLGMFSDAGVRTSSFFILGLPTQTKQEMLDTLKFAEEANLDYPFFPTALPLPGSEMFEMTRHKHNFNEEANFADLYAHKSAVNCSDVPDDEFKEICEQAFAITVKKLNGERLRSKIKKHGLVLTGMEEIIEKKDDELQMPETTRAEIKENTGGEAADAALYKTMKALLAIKNKKHSFEWHIREIVRGENAIEAVIADNSTNKSCAVRIKPKDSGEPYFAASKHLSLLLKNKGADINARMQKAVEALAVILLRLD